MTFRQRLQKAVAARRAEPNKPTLTEALKGLSGVSFSLAKMGWFTMKRVGASLRAMKGFAAVEAVDKEREAERLDRLRHPEKYKNLPG